MNRYSSLAFVATSISLVARCDENDDENFTVFGGSYTTSNEQLARPPVVQIRVTGVGDMNNLGPGKFVAYSTQNLTPPLLSVCPESVRRPSKSIAMYSILLLPAQSHRMGMGQIQSLLTI